MIEIGVTVEVPIDEAFATLTDGWLYSSWVVGASHIRAVDPEWPAVGSRIHHSVGPWPFTMRDHTTVLAVQEPHRLELEARLWPFGAAYVRLTLREEGPGRTRIEMAEKAVKGPGVVVPDLAQGLLLAPRNRESLHRLADLVRGRADKG
ncbi:SRPBCC family protein [Nocardia harenae]|uniref:SRPBCC family protein n=1 Tax=Nocardia harenae TaxID=358707 RepID=UPI00082B3AC8|nr:SRPBCC family protein [Nocardia harenae]